MSIARLPGPILLSIAATIGPAWSQARPEPDLRARVAEAGLAEVLRAIDRGGAPGACAFGVLRLRSDAGDGAERVETWIGVAGHTDAEGRRPLHRGSLLPLGAVSRAVVVLATLEAIEDGRLDPSMSMRRACGPVVGSLPILTRLGPVDMLLDDRLFGECYLRVRSSAEPVDLARFLGAHHPGLTAVGGDGRDEPGIALLAQALAVQGGHASWAEAITRGVGRGTLSGLVARPHLASEAQELARFDAAGELCEGWRGGFPAAFDVWGTPRSGLRVAQELLGHTAERQFEKVAKLFRGKAALRWDWLNEQYVGPVACIWQDDLPGHFVRLVLWPEHSMAILALATGPMSAELLRCEERIAAVYGLKPWPLPSVEGPGLVRGKYLVSMRWESELPIGGRTVPVVASLNPHARGRRAPYGAEPPFGSYTFDGEASEYVEIRPEAELRVAGESMQMQVVYWDQRGALFRMDLGDGERLVLEVDRPIPVIARAVFRLEVDGVSSVPYPARRASDESR